MGCTVTQLHDAPATGMDDNIVAGLQAASKASQPLLQRVLAAAPTQPAAAASAGSCPAAKGADDGQCSNPDSEVSSFQHEMHLALYIRLLLAPARKSS